MSTTEGAGGTPARGVSVHTEISCNSESENAETLRRRYHGNRLLDPRLANFHAVSSGNGSDYQQGESCHRVDDAPGRANGRGGDAVDNEGRSSTYLTAGFSTSQPLVSSHSTCTRICTPTAERPGYHQRPEFPQCPRLPPWNQPAEQRQSTRGGSRDKVRLPCLQPSRATEAGLLIDAAQEPEDATPENTATHAATVALKSSIPSVLITSPSLGRISVLCSPVSPPPAHREKTSAGAWIGRADTVTDRRSPQPASTDFDDETLLAMHVSSAVSPLGAQPLPLASKNGGISNFSSGDSSLEDGEGGQRGTKYIWEGGRHAPFDKTPSTTCRGIVSPSETRMTARQHMNCGVDRSSTFGATSGHPEAVGLEGEMKPGGTAIPGGSPRGEHTAYTNTSSKTMAVGRSGSPGEGGRIIRAAESQRDLFHSAVSGGTSGGSENDNVDRAVADEPVTRRRYSLPAEGALFYVTGGRRLGSVKYASHRELRRHEAPSWDGSGSWKPHENKFDLPGRKNRRQSIDCVRSDREDTDACFLASSAASQDHEADGRIAAPLRAEETAVAAAGGPRAGVASRGVPRQAPNSTDGSLFLDSVAAPDGRENPEGSTRPSFEERRQGAGVEYLGATALSRSAPAREQGMMRLQQPLLCTAFREAAHAAAAAARVRSLAKTGGGNKTPLTSLKFGDELRRTAESSSLPVASGTRASGGDTSPPLSVKQGAAAATELSGPGTVAEGGAKDAITERQMCRRKADRGLRTSSGTSVASSDQSNAASPFVKNVERELMLLGAEQGRVVGEAAAVTACVAAACVRRAALYPVRRLILNTLHHWQQIVEPMSHELRKPNFVGSHGRRAQEHSLLGTQETDREQQVFDFQVPPHVVYTQEESAFVPLQETLLTVQAEVRPRRSSHETDFMSAPLSKLLHGSLPPCADAAVFTDRTNHMSNFVKEKLAGGIGQLPYQHNGRTTSGPRCVRVTLFASNQVLRWRHLRQRVTLFTDKTSPYYFWPPWGGSRFLVEAGGSALLDKLLKVGLLEGRDREMGRPLLSRQTNLEESIAPAAEEDGIIGCVRNCNTSREESVSSGDSNGVGPFATPVSRENNRGPKQPHRVSEDELEDQEALGGSETKVKMGLVCSSAGSLGSACATPTKCKPDFSDSENQRDTTATLSSPPSLVGNESGQCVSTESTLVPEGCQPRHPDLEQVKNESQQRANGSLCTLSMTTDALYPSPSHAAASSVISEDTGSTQAGQDSCVDIPDVSSTSAAAATSEPGCRAGSNSDDVHSGRDEWTLRSKRPDVSHACAKDTTLNERSRAPNYQHHHAIVPFLPNLLASTRTTRANATQRATLSLGSLRLPFADAGTVYVLRTEACDSGASNTKEKDKKETSGQSEGAAPDSAVHSAQGVKCDPEAEDTTRTPPNSGSDPLPDISASQVCGLEEGNEGVEQRHAEDPQTGGSIIAMWACRASCMAPSEKTEAPTGGLFSCESRATEQAIQKRFWWCPEAASSILRDCRSNGPPGAFTSTQYMKMTTAKDRCGTDVCAVRSTSRTTESYSTKEAAHVSYPACEPSKDKDDNKHLNCTGHEQKAEQVLEDMQQWCQARSHSAVKRDSSQEDKEHSGSPSVKVVSLESFAAAYNELAENAVRHLLTRLRARGEHALPPAACHLLEERARVASRRRREEARCVQQQLRTKLQQLIRNYNTLLTREQKASNPTASCGQDHGDGSVVRSGEQERLEQQFQHRLRELQQRVEYHLRQHRQLASSVLRHMPRRQGRHRNSYVRTEQLAAGPQEPRRRLQWYSVGIRWLRTRAALEYFVVRHRQHDVSKGHSPGRQRRRQRYNHESVIRQDRRLSRTGLPDEAYMAKSNNATALPRACPSQAAEDRPTATLKRRLPGSQRRRSSSSGEEWKNSGQSTGPHGASGAACASGRNSVYGDEENKDAFYLPTVPPVGPVGMSPVTVSEASTPVALDSPPLSSNEDRLSGVSSKGSSQQRCYGAHSRTHTYTSSVLLLHELLQPMRLDSGGIRAALVLVVHRLRRFIRVVRTQGQAENTKSRSVTTHTSNTSHVPGRVQQVHDGAGKEINSDIRSADGGKASQGYVTVSPRAKIYTGSAEGMNLRAQLSELTKLQSDFTALTARSATRSLHSWRTADYFTSAYDDISNNSVSKQPADPRGISGSKMVDSTVNHIPVAVAGSQPHLQPRAGHLESADGQRLREESCGEFPTQRQFPGSSIRMALVLPNLGIQLQQILSSEGSMCEHHHDQSWVGGGKDAPMVGRETGWPAHPDTRSRHSAYERNYMTRRGGEASGTVAQSSQPLESGSLSPVSRKPGVAGMVGTADAAEARAARAAARAAAAETRVWRLREREEVDTRAGGLSDHAVHGNAGSPYPRKAERSRRRSSPDRSVRKVDGDGVIAGDEAEDDTFGECKPATSGASLRVYGKHGETNTQNAPSGLSRTSSPQPPQRLRRSCVVSSVNHNVCALKKKSAWAGSDEEPCTADSPADSAARMQARSTMNGKAGEAGNQLPPVEGGALEPFWWEACCAKFHSRAQLFIEGRKRSSFRTVASSEAVGDGGQLYGAAEIQLDVVNQGNSEDILVATGKERVQDAGELARHGYPCAINAEHICQERLRSIEGAHSDGWANSGSATRLTRVEQIQHIARTYRNQFESSSSDLASSNEESGTERGTSTASDSSEWSKQSSNASDLSVEPSTILQQLSPQHVGASSAFSSGGTAETARAHKSSGETCSNTDMHDAPQGTEKTLDHADACNDDSNVLATKPGAPSTNMESVVGKTATAQERIHVVTEQVGSAPLDAHPSAGDAGGQAITKTSVERRGETDVDQQDRLQAAVTASALKRAALFPSTKTKSELLVEDELRDAADDDPFSSQQMSSVAAPQLIVMPGDELISADLRTMLPKLRVVFLTCFEDLTPRKELQVVQSNGDCEYRAFRPQRSLRRLWTALRPILHTLQMLSTTEEGRAWTSGKPPINLSTAGGVVNAADANGQQVHRAAGTTADVIGSALVSAAADVAEDPAVLGLMTTPGRFEAYLQEKNVTSSSSPANPVTLALCKSLPGDGHFPKQLTTTMSQTLLTGDRERFSKVIPEQIAKLNAIIADATLFLSGVLDVDAAEVEARKEKAENEVLTSLIHFPAIAVSHAMAGSRDALERDDWAAVDLSEEVSTGDEERGRTRKRMKMEGMPRFYHEEPSGAELHHDENPPYPCGRHGLWKVSDVSESLFDFGPQKNFAEDAFSKIKLHSPRAFGRRIAGSRRLRRPGVRNGLQTDAPAFVASRDEDRASKAPWEDYALKELRLAYKFSRDGDEGPRTRRRGSRGRTPLFLRPDAWEALDDESASSSSAEKTSAYGPLSSGSESVYLSVPSSPRRRLQQRQHRWRSRRLDAGTSGTYHLTNAELGGDLSAEGLDKSFLDSSKRAYAGRASRRGGVGSVYRIFQNLPGSTGGTAILQGGSSSQPLSPPLTRGAAALSGGQIDATAHSESTMRERRRTTQQDRLLSRYLPEKLSKRQFATAPCSQAQGQPSVSRLQRSRGAPAIAAPSLAWSGPECSLPTTTRKKLLSGSTGGSQQTPKNYSSTSDMNNQLGPTEGAFDGSPGGAGGRSVTVAAGRGGNLDSPRENPRPGRRTPTAGSPVPTGVYFDASRKLWRCQWRENGRFKTKGFSLNTYGTLKDARKACIIYRCLMGGWEVDPRWLADNDSQESGDNGLSEGHPLEEEGNVGHRRAAVADGSQSEVEHGDVGDVGPCAAAASMPSDATDASEPGGADVVHRGGVDAERVESCASAQNGEGVAEDASAATVSCAPAADAVVPH